METPSHDRGDNALARATVRTCKKFCPFLFVVSCTLFRRAYVRAPTALRSPPLIFRFTHTERIARSPALLCQGIRESRTNVKRCGIRFSRSREMRPTSLSFDFPSQS